MSTEVHKMLRFQHFRIKSRDSESMMEMAGEPGCCQTPIQNAIEDISVDLSMLLQPSLQETSSSAEVLQEQDGAEECPTINLHLPECTISIVLVSQNLTQ